MSKSIMFGDLTADGQKNYKTAWTIYQDDTRLYKEQKDALIKLTTDTVSIHYRDVAYNPSDPLPVWYNNLKESVSATDYLEQNNARRRYRDGLKSPKTSINGSITGNGLSISPKPKDSPLHSQRQNGSQIC